MGVESALEKNAAFFIDPEDIGHVHLLVSKEGYAKLSKKKYETLELMEKTEALLFHSQEFTFSPNLYPTDVRKRRNLYFAMDSDEIEILDTDKYKVNQLYTIFSDEHLDMVELFQVSFDRLPFFADNSCKTPQMILRGSLLQRIAVTKVLFTGAGNGKFKTNNIIVSCFCSGKVEPFSVN